MHLPAPFALSPDEGIARLERRPFAVLVTRGATGLEATHLPFLVLRDPLRLVGHLARSNSQALARDCRGLMIWSGPDAYVSPSFYPSKARHGRVVPTWNYEAVHVEGALRWFTDPVDLEGLLDAETARFEGARPFPWAMSDAPQPYLEAMVGGVVGFELAADTILGARKFSQNKDAEDREGVRRGLEGSQDPREQAAGRTMNADRTMNE